MRAAENADGRGTRPMRRARSFDGHYEAPKPATLERDDDRAASFSRKQERRSLTPTLPALLTSCASPKVSANCFA